MLNGKHRQPVPGPLCASFTPLLPVLDDLADTRLARDTRAHLAECAWCRAQRATYDKFDEALRLHFAPAATPIFADNAMETLMSDIRDEIPTVARDPETASAREDDTSQRAVSPLPIPPQPPKRSWRLATGAAGLAAVLVISLLAGLLFMSQGRPQAATTNKHATATPGVALGSQTMLMAIGMSSPTDGWAMGIQIQAGHNGGSSDDPAYVLHYTGGRWTQVKTVIQGEISQIRMLSQNDGWAVGSAAGNVSDRVYHYDGASWSKAHLPVNTVFNVIAALSPKDIWLAGYGEVPDGTVTILHYNGATWTREPTPTLPDTDFTISSLSMVSPREGWAVGYAIPNSHGSQQEFYPPTGAILHYVNGTWQLFKTLPGMNLQTVSMGSATDGWIGGYLVTLSKTGPMPPGQSPDETDTAKLWRYTDGEWIEAALPQSADSPSGQVMRITMSSPTQGWMFAILNGASPSPDKPTPIAPEIFRLESGHWVQVGTPAVQQRRGVSIWNTVFLSPDEFWGVGDSIWWTGIPTNTSHGYTPTVTPLIVHYKSGSWDIVES